MPEFDGLLMRDDTVDTGVVPSPGYYYHSPDVIAHAQVASPKTYFTNNYTTNPNQAVQLGSSENFIYVRAKNLSSSAKSGYYCSVYRSKSSLFMTPSIWKNNKLLTESGNSYVSFDTVQPNGIVVGNDHFLLSGLSSDLFCVIGIASDQQNPTLPSDFSTYSAYISWVRNNQNVCGNNLRFARDYPNRQFERLDHFANPQSDDVPVLIMVTATGLPDTTTFGATCVPAGINKSQTVQTGNILTVSGMVPADFDGTVTTFGTLASGGTWPSGATLTTKVYVGQEAQSDVAKYATPWELFAEIGVTPDQIDYLPENGVLVLLGSTGTQFST